MENELSRVVDVLPGLVWTALPDGRVDFINQYWCQLTGLSVDEGHGSGWQTAVHPQDLPQLLERWRSILASGKPDEMEARLRRSDGEYSSFVWRVSPLADASGVVVKWCGLGIDIDERMQAEEALRASERQFRLIVDGLPVLLSTATPDGELDQANRHYLDYFGATLAELKARGAVHSLHPDDRERVLPVRKAAIEAGRPYEIECRRRRADGVYRWFCLRAFPLRDAEGRVALWYRLHIDIEDQKEAERGLQLTIDSIPTLVETYRPDGSLIFVNQTWRDYADLSLETATETELFSCIHPDDAPRVTPEWHKSLVTGVPFQAELRLRRADGEYRWYLIHRVAARDETGAIVMWYSVGADIEDRKRAEQKAVEAEHELRHTIDHIPVLVATYRPDGSRLCIDKRARESDHHPAAEDWRRTIHPDDLEFAESKWRACVASGEEYELEVRVRMADGTYRWHFSRRVPVRDEAGTITRWYGIGYDIEDRKRAEQKVVEAERELQWTIDHIPVLVASYHTDGSRLYVNKRIREHTDHISTEDWRRTIHPDDLEFAESKWRACVASGEEYELEVRVRMADGTYRWHLTHRVPLRDEAGKITRWYGIGYDIEDRKRAEEELRRSEAFLAKAQRLSLTGSFSFDSTDEEFTWSEELYRIFEFQPGIRVTLPLIGSRCHPEDRHVMEETAERIQRGDTELDYEHRLLMPDGSIKWVHVVAQASRRDKDGRGLEYFGAGQDVTQRRLAEVAIDNARSELARVTRVMSLGTLTASIAHEINQPLAGIITNANTCLRMLAADPPNVDGARETARRTIRDGNRTSQVITRLRALFGKRGPTAEPVDLNNAVREVIALSLSILQRDRVILRTELADDLPLVTGDRVQLQQVILNLLQNASDAMSPVEDRPKQLLIRTERDEGDRVRLTVRDSGIGFGPQALDRVFDAFYTTKNDGMGIGLSVSRSIIESHHGRLWAAPNDGPGATFSFSIPRLPEGVTNVRSLDAMRTHAGTAS
jgi:PAS domain S-box-containing protein